MPYSMENHVQKITSTDLRGDFQTLSPKKRRDDYVHFLYQ